MNDNQEKRTSEPDGGAPRTGSSTNSRMSARQRVVLGVLAAFCVVLIAVCGVALATSNATPTAPAGVVAAQGSAPATDAAGNDAAAADADDAVAAADDAAATDNEDAAATSSADSSATASMGNADGDSAQASATSQQGGSTSSKGSSSKGSSSSANTSSSSSSSSSSHSSSSNPNSSSNSSSSSSSGGASSAGQAGGTQQQAVTISVSIDSSAADGSVGGSGTFTFPAGATPYDALCAVRSDVTASNSGFGVYVEGIGGLYEQDERYPGVSGWKYMVNGSVIMKAANKYTLHDGDHVTWYYTVTG